MTDVAPFPFVVGRGRSGTTLLRAILNAHPDLAIPGESPMIAKFGPHRSRYESATGFLADRLADDLVADGAFRRWGFAEGDVRRAIAEGAPRSFGDAVRAMYRAYAAREGKSRHGDKAANHVLFMDKIAALLPESRFVHLIRDGRDVSLSFLDAEFGDGSLGQLAAEWDRFVRKGRASGRALGGGRYLEVRYERLVSDPEATAREVCAFLSLEFHPEMLRYHEHAEPFIAGLAFSGEHRNLAKPPTRGMRDWRVEMDPADVARFEAIAGDLLEELGYERVSDRGSVRSRVAAQRDRVEVVVRSVVQSMRRRRKTVATFRKASGREADGSERVPGEETSA